jgi:hypothetical protein
MAVTVLVVIAPAVVVETDVIIASKMCVFR